MASSRPARIGDSHHGNASLVARMARSRRWPAACGRRDAPSLGATSRGVVARRRLPVEAPSSRARRARTGYGTASAPAPAAASDGTRSARSRQAPRAAEAMGLAAHDETRRRGAWARAAGPRRGRTASHRGGVGSRPDREQLVRLDEVLGRYGVRRYARTGASKRQETRARAATRRRRAAGQEDGAMDRVQARLGHAARVLQVAVAPAAVALQLVEQVRRHLLVAAVDLVGDPDLPAARRIRAASTKSCDMISPESGPAPGQRPERAWQDERRMRRIALWPQ